MFLGSSGNAEGLSGDWATFLPATVRKDRRSQSRVMLVPSVIYIFAGRGVLGWTSLHKRKGFSSSITRPRPHTGGPTGDHILRLDPGTLHQSFGIDALAKTEGQIRFQLSRIVSVDAPRSRSSHAG